MPIIFGWISCGIAAGHISYQKYLDAYAPSSLVITQSPTLSRAGTLASIAMRSPVQLVGVIEYNTAPFLIVGVLRSCKSQWIFHSLRHARISHFEIEGVPLR